MNRAVIYTRVSTEEQANQGLSLDVQTATCTKKLDEDKFQLVEVLRDEGLSGGSLNRPGIKRLLELAQKGEIDRVYMVHSDRLARNVEDHYRVRRILEDNKVSVVYTMQPNMGDSSAFAKTADGLFAVMNESFRLITGEKTFDAMVAKAKAGWRPGLAPLGYKNVVNPNSTSKLDRNIIVKDEEAAPLVVELFQLYSTGAYNGNQLAEIMYRKGLRSVQGNMVRANKIYELLKNPFYIGELHWDDVHLLKAAHQPIVSQDLFTRVGLVMAGHNHYASRKRKHTWLLGGFAFCNYCGKRYVGERHEKKNQTYYHCIKKTAECGSYVHAERLEDAVAKKFGTFNFSDDFVTAVVEEARKILMERSKGVEDKRKALANKRIGLEHKRSMAEQKLLGGVLDDGAFTRINSQISEDIDTIDAQMIRLEKERRVSGEQIQLILRFAKDIEEAYQKADLGLKRHYLGLFFEKFEVRNGSIERTTFTPLFSHLVKTNKLFIRAKQKPLAIRQRAFVTEPTKKTVQVSSEWGG